MPLPTFDIEAVNWTIPIAVGFFDGFNYMEFVKEDDKDEPLRKFLEFLRVNHRGIKLYAHFASRYDNKLVLAQLSKMNERIGLEAGLIRLKWIEPGITFEDSFPLIPMSLKKATKLFGAPEKGEWDHDAGLKPWEMGNQLKTFKLYLKNDCIALSNCLDTLCECLGNTFGVMPSISLATTSAKAFNKGFFNLDDIESNEEFEPFIRQAIYGGRNEVYKRYGENIKEYDVKSMFVSCYDTPVPTGKMKWMKADLNTGCIAEATVKVPKDSYIGPLPFRTPDGRLIFPVGEFKGWWDVRELKNAVDNFGADVTIRRQLDSMEKVVLKEFGEYIGELRGGKYDEFWKMFGLSLSGKLGQNRWRETVKHWEFIEDFQGWWPLDKEETYFISKEYARRAPYIKAAVSMRIRAEARIRHLNHILKAATLGEIFYGDTDSIFTTATLPTGDNIGDLSMFGLAERGYFIKQKLYAIIEDGKMRQRSAGFSDLKLVEADFKKLLEGGDIDIKKDSISTYKLIMHEKEAKLFETWRKVKGRASSSRISEDLDSRPICLPEDLKLLYL